MEFPPDPLPGIDDYSYGCFCIYIGSQNLVRPGDLMLMITWHSSTTLSRSSCTSPNERHLLRLDSAGPPPPGTSVSPSTVRPFLVRASLFPVYEATAPSIPDS
ncbi:hypothetical protein M408DRAFT_103658 [Serendipita vermifera MAFF 305830]|uniref:Uncharacterized protein n=1 Tax=Serendipita vermifera MAFF 305830 TaxID=933852 RepID=A0A0C2WVN7_SERVB|nr:hypothetical protein M408DRAFT_103658 [Serendipita vermifera MAFF 305830]